MRKGWIDITVPLREGMPVWPGDPPVRLERVAAIERGDPYNLTAISACLHTGTHVDAPLHYVSGGAGIESMPPGALIGPARVIGIRRRSAIRPDDLSGRRIRRGERLLFRTPNSRRTPAAARRVPPDYVSLSLDAARSLARCGVSAVGIDALSIGPPDEEGDAVHRVLLDAGVWIVEGLDLSRVAPGGYDLVCLPLNIPGADGAPARALLRAR